MSKKESFEAILERLQHSTDYQEIDEVQDDLARLGRKWDLAKKKIDELEQKVTELSWDGSLNRAEEKLDQAEARVRELERENKKLRGAFHQMKLNSKLLLDLTNSLKKSIEINADDAKEWCDEICIKELK